MTAILLGRGFDQGQFVRFIELYIPLRLKPETIVTLPASALPRIGTKRDLSHLYFFEKFVFLCKKGRLLLLLTF